MWGDGDASGGHAPVPLVYTPTRGAGRAADHDWRELDPMPTRSLSMWRFSLSLSLGP